jgi:hypothetical protein
MKLSRRGTADPTSLLTKIEMMTRMRNATSGFVGDADQSDIMPVHSRSNQMTTSRDEQCCEIEPNLCASADEIGPSSAITINKKSPSTGFLSNTITTPPGDQTDPEPRWAAAENALSRTPHNGIRHQHCSNVPAGIN